MKTAIDTVLLEVSISTREVGTSYRETHAKYEAVQAFTEDLATLEARRAVQDLRDEGQVASYLDTMLDAQDRRSRAEEEFIRSAANYQIAIVNLQRAKGQLLNYSEISVVRSRDDATNLPQLNLVKRPKDGKATQGVNAGK
ncbi:hypothetical protein [Roseimicrobium sp. ORNL1]|uniref:hypothetical protein n=1 Tax=Roseimicrobium sp. ORNL1 TaxID=2711231 RepID=UPI00197F0C2F|nr:hypothetical protein [Roseimicrobium sp. ORNL1]